MLYWFRTPPNVKVGRVPLDEEAIRTIEKRNPDVAFDWKRMLKLGATLKANQRAEASSRPVKKRRRRATAKASEPTSMEPQPSGEPLETPPPTGVADDVSPDPDVLEAEAHLDAEAGADEPAEEPAEHPVVALLGDETLVRLRARYAEIRARISEKMSEPEALSAMLARADSIDPDRWSSVEAAVRGIERFEAKIEGIRADLGRRPPRTRRAE